MSNIERRSAFGVNTQNELWYFVPALYSSVCVTSNLLSYRNTWCDWIFTCLSRKDTTSVDSQYEAWNRWGRATVGKAVRASGQYRAKSIRLVPHQRAATAERERERTHEIRHNITLHFQHLRSDSGWGIWCRFSSGSQDEGQERTVVVGHEAHVSRQWSTARVRQNTSVNLFYILNLIHVQCSSTNLFTAHKLLFHIYKGFDKEVSPETAQEILKQMKVKSGGENECRF